MTNMSYLERSEKRAGTAFPKRESRRREEGEARAWLKEPILRLRCLPSTWDGSVAGVQTELLGVSPKHVFFFLNMAAFTQRGLPGHSVIKGFSY